MSGKRLDFTLNTLMHDAFKRELGRIQSAVAVLADNPGADASGVVNRWQFFSEQLAHHHESEDKFIWPIILERTSKPSEVVVMDAMESEHSAMQEQLDLVDAQFAKLGSGEVVDLNQLGQQLDDLSVIVSGHCEHEEHDGMIIAQEYLKSEDLSEFHKFTRSGPDSTLVFPWICDGASEADQKAAWGVLPGFVRVVARPIMTRKYVARRAEFG